MIYLGTVTTITANYKLCKESSKAPCRCHGQAKSLVKKLLTPDLGLELGMGRAAPRAVMSSCSSGLRCAVVVLVVVAAAVGTS